MPSAIQRSFAGGEIAPALYGRADQAKFQTGLRTCENFMVQRYGGVTNRPGFQFITEVKDSDDNARLIPFVVNETNSYVLEFGDLYVRFIKNAAQLGGPYEIVSPYAHTDVGDIQFAQIGDVMTLTHPSYPVYELKRFGDVSWTLTVKTFRPSIDAPTGVNVVTGGSGAGKTYEYQVTAMSPSAEESLEGTNNMSGGIISAATQADPCDVTHGGSTPLLSDGDRVEIIGIVGMTELNDRRFDVYDVDATSFKLTGIDSTNYTAYSSVGTVTRIGEEITNANVPTVANPHVITWNDVPAAAFYNIYRRTDDGEYGLIGIADQVTPAVGTVQFNDTGVATEDTLFQPPVYAEPFATERDASGNELNYPKTVAYHQQRIWFAGTVNRPEGVWAGRIGNYSDFGANGLGDAEPFNFDLAGGSVSEVQSMISVGRIMIFTNSSEWTLEGNEFGGLTPTSINARQHDYVGADKLQPVAIGNNALFVQARGKQVLDFRYRQDRNGYAGRELTIFANHLFDKIDDDIIRITYQQIPHGIMWTVKEDGELLGLTYLPEHEVWGWHRHSSGASAFFLDVVSVPERQTVIPESDTIREDFLYVLVQRTIDGSDVKYIERLASRDRAIVLNDMNFSDSFLSYDGTNLTLAGFDDTATATLTTGGGWLITDDLTLTMSEDTFGAGDVGNGMWLTGADGSKVFVTITAFTSAKIVTCNPDRTVPSSLQSTATTIWAFAVDEVAGLDHLEGEEVKILADGFVITDDTVASGTLTFTRPYAIIHVGLGYNADMETLDVESGGATLLDKQKRVNRVSLLLQDSRGGWCGPDEDNLVEMKQRSTEGYDDPVSLRTGVAKIIVKATWNNHGRSLVRQIDPLPITVLAVIPSLLVGK